MAYNFCSKRLVYLCLEEDTKAIGLVDPPAGGDLTRISP